ncbi:Signal transduction histidine kinase [Nonomuraea jiangxiensis]|uniref:histidine kinase n=2 Tax=Nonomuraea jiangxiensis TaxID=633440 RepID=A0A1G9CAL0_9ACTN|nr:Signal transduction histidine kinase [Nonomuraea jiangxiensis]
MAYLVTGVGVGAIVLVVFLGFLFTGAVMTLLLVGIPMVVALGLGGVPVAALERKRLRIIDGAPAGTPHRVPGQPGLRAWLELRYKEQATWRELAYTGLLIMVLWPIELAIVVYGLVVPIAMICTPLALSEADVINVLKVWHVETYPKAFFVAAVGVVTLVLAVYPLTALAMAHATLARFLLTPRDDEPGERLAELTRSRTRLVEAFEAERRRIERDLHDGAQQRLVSLTMMLGLAKMSRGEEATELVDEAHRQAKLALAEIRDLIGGIHPRILTDRGLPTALAEVADRSPVPVEVSVDFSERLPAPVESVAYFVVCEALANVAKHSKARHATVEGRFEDGMLAVEIRDDGVGGADASAGTGLAGLADRVSVVDGKLMLSSPAGGPTLLRVEIPCASNAPSR